MSRSNGLFTRFALLLCTAGVALFLAACGGDDGDNGPDAAPQADAPLQQLVNALGQVCDESTPCPDSPAHSCVYLNIGSEVQGYCSPVCADNLDCSEGYDGPATGELTCFTPNDPQACSIGCEVAADCPEDLECLPTGGPMSFCGVPPQQ